MRRCATFAAALLATSASGAPRAEAQGPRADGLYRQMLSCLADPEQGLPCAVTDPGRGFVLIKDDDPKKPFAWLLVPSTDVTGIEAPAVFTAPVAEFWQIGWGFAGQLLPAPPEGRALAINSKPGRTQNLLHIHVSCIPLALRAALAQADIGPDWRAGPFLTVAAMGSNAGPVIVVDREATSLVAGSSSTTLEATQPHATNAPRARILFIPPPPNDRAIYFNTTTTTIT